MMAAYVRSPPRQIKTEPQHFSIPELTLKLTGGSAALFCFHDSTASLLPAIPTGGE